MSNPGYLAAFEEGSVAQDIAKDADAEAAIAQEGLRAPSISIPLEDVLAEQERFAALAADGHRGTEKLHQVYTTSELADRDAQVAYDLFADAALPAELAAHRFAVIDGEADFHLSDETLRKMTKNEGAEAPVQAAELHEGGSVSLASAAVTTARGRVRTAHIGIKRNLVAVKTSLLEDKREAAQDEVEDYEAKIAQVAGALDFFGSISGKVSAASAVMGALDPDASTEDLKAGGEVALDGVPAAVDLVLGKPIADLKVEIAAQTKMIGSLARLDEKLELEQHTAEYADALADYEQKVNALQLAVHAKRAKFAKAGRLADDALKGTPEEGQASQAMLVGSAASEASVLLDAAIAEHAIATQSVQAARDSAANRRRTYWYRVSGGFASGDYEVEKDHLAGERDEGALRKMAEVLKAWGRRAAHGKETLDAATGEFEAKVIDPAGAPPGAAY